MYFLETSKEAELLQLVKHILKGDQTSEPCADMIEMEPPPVPKKKRKHSARLVSVSQAQSLQQLGQISTLN